MESIINEVVRVIVFVWEALLHVWPLLVISIPLAVLIKEMDVSTKVNNMFKKNIWVSIFIATLIGAVAPFCSCGIIPVISAMLIAGVPIAPVMSFWLASPSMDPEIFFLSVGSLGWSLAVARIVATFLMSIAGGVITHLLLRKMNAKEFLLVNRKKKLRAAAGGAGGNAVMIEAMDANSEACGCGGAETVEIESCGCGETEVEHSEGCGDSCGTKNKEVSRGRHLLISAFESMWFVLKFLLIAYVLQALIIFYVPTDAVVGVFGTDPTFSVVLATFIGIPLYTTNLSALGLVSGLLAKGLSGGAGLAFLVGGATTTVPAMAAVYKLVDRRIFAIYIGVTLVFAMVSGIVFNVIEVMLL